MNLGESQDRTVQLDSCGILDVLKYFSFVSMMVLDRTIELRI